MKKRIAINGFGRIGRSVFRILSQRSDMEVVCINDLFPSETLAYLLKHDTVMGKFAPKVEAGNTELRVDGQAIPLSQCRDPAALPWKKLDVDWVVESTGHFRARSDLTLHLNAGAKRVLLTVPPKDEIDAVVVMGVNEQSLRPEHRLISNASCTTNCLAPIAKVLDEAFGLDWGWMTTIHAYTNDQRLADVPHADFRRSRAAGENIIPTTTGAARAVGIVLPNLRGKLDGMAVRVPVPDGSLVDLSMRLNQAASAKDIHQAVQQAAQGPMQGILAFEPTPLVSSDIIGNPHSSIFDPGLTQATGDGYARVVCWYDNEWGYANRCIDVLATAPVDNA